MGKLEKWVPVIGYDGLYDVSDLGRVRSAINRKKQQQLFNCLFI